MPLSAEVRPSMLLAAGARADFMKASPAVAVKRRVPVADVETDPRCLDRTTPTANQTSPLGNDEASMLNIDVLSHQAAAEAAAPEASR